MEVFQFFEGRRAALAFILLFVLAPLSAQTAGGTEGNTAQTPKPNPLLTVEKGDVIVEAHDDGYHLFVRKKPNVASIMLTESFETPTHNLATYSYRAIAPNDVNGSEKRLLDGKFLVQPNNYLISSTPIDYPALGKSFHVLIPKQVDYGYKNVANARYALIDVQKQIATPGEKFWFSIRAFEKPYGDYSGTYQNNAFELKTILEKQTPVVSDDHYTEGLYTGFSRLGKPYRSKGTDDSIDQIKKALENSKDTVDMVLCIDTTLSMKENLKILKANLLNSIRDEVKKFKSFRIGLVFYKDYMEEYLTKTVAFQTDLDRIQAELDKSSAGGGGDVPEAVVEALYAGLSRFDWQAESRVIILLGDAPQHPTPRGSITEGAVHQLAQDKSVEIQMVLLPQTAF